MTPPRKSAFTVKVLTYPEPYESWYNKYFNTNDQVVQYFRENYTLHFPLLTMKCMWRSLHAHITLKTNNLTWFHCASNGTNHIVNPCDFVVAVNVHFYLSSVLGRKSKEKIHQIR